MNQILCKCRKLTKLCAAAVLSAALIGSSTVVHMAAPAAVSVESVPQIVHVTVNGADFTDAVLLTDTTYVDLIALCAAMGIPATAEIGGGYALVRTPDAEITLTDGAVYLEAAERALPCPRGVFIHDGTIWVPIRTASAVLGCSVCWDEEDFAAHVTPDGPDFVPGEAFYDADALYWMARIIYAEAGAEPFAGQIAVGNVVLNRLRSENFPDTVYGVIFDRKWGVQFTPTANGMIWREPDAEAVLAAKLCLEGYSLSAEILYFLNAALAENLWVPQNRRYVMTISGHDFYA